MEESIFRPSRESLKEFEREALPHLDALYRAALGIVRDSDLARELVQETFKEALGSFHTYRRGTNCKAWLFRIFYRSRSRYFKSQHRAQWTPLDETPEMELAVTGFHDAVDARIALEVIHSLPEHYQTVMVLADIEQLSYREVAQALEIPIGTVMSRLNRARGLVREKLTAPQAPSVPAVS